MKKKKEENDDNVIMVEDEEEMNKIASKNNNNNNNNNDDVLAEAEEEEPGTRRNSDDKIELADLNPFIRQASDTQNNDKPLSPRSQMTEFTPQTPSNVYRRQTIDNKGSIVTEQQHQPPGADVGVVGDIGAVGAAIVPVKRIGERYSHAQPQTGLTGEATFEIDENEDGGGGGGGIGVGDSRDVSQQQLQENTVIDMDIAAGTDNSTTNNTLTIKEDQSLQMKAESLKKEDSYLSTNDNNNKSAKKTMKILKQKSQKLLKKWKESSSSSWLLLNFGFCFFLIYLFYFVFFFWWWKRFFFVCVNICVFCICFEKSALFVLHFVCQLHLCTAMCECVRYLQNAG